MKKERKVRADDDREPLGEVPVPGMSAVEICHAVQDVELQEVELNQGPLTNTTKSATYIWPHKHSKITSNLFATDVLPFHRKYSRSRSKPPKPKP